MQLTSIDESRRYDLVGTVNDTCLLIDIDIRANLRDLVTNYEKVRICRRNVIISTMQE